MLSSFDNNLEKLDGLETKFVKTLYYDLPANYEDKYSSKDSIRLCTIVEGEKNLEIGSKNIIYSKNQFLILPPHSSVNMFIPKRTKAFVIELSDKLISNVASKLIDYKTDSTGFSATSVIGFDKRFILKDNDPSIKSDVEYLKSYAINQLNQDPFLVDLYAQKLVYDLLKIFPYDYLISLRSNSELDRAIGYIHAHLKEPIKVGSLSEISGMSESNFSHTFKKIYGESPQKYIHNAKLDLSIELLKQESVTDVALQLGFDNISHFIKLFKNKFELTPKQYQIKYF